MFEKEAEERTKRYMNEHTEKYNCENTKIETDNYNAGLECGYEEGFKDGSEFGYNKANEWHYCKDELPPIGETVLLFYGNDAIGKVVMSTGSIDCKGNWYKNVDDTPIMWQSINLPSNKNITRDYLYCDNQLLSERC